MITTLTIVLAAYILIGIVNGVRALRRKLKPQPKVFVIDSISEYSRLLMDQEVRKYK